MTKEAKLGVYQFRYTAEDKKIMDSFLSEGWTVSQVLSKALANYHATFRAPEYHAPRSAEEAHAQGKTAWFNEETGEGVDEEGESYRKSENI